MNCPFCGHTKSKVTNKRESPEGVRRRRECLKCTKRYTTYEQVSKQDLYVVKKDNTRELFNAEKIKHGLDRVFLKRPFSKEKIYSIASQIEEQLRKTGKKEINSKKIGELLIRKIKKLDKVAYIRFASVYRDYKDIDDFVEEIKELE
ncbi:MAG: transcriptional regulator NrdR [Nanoarchaeota archaeon]|jgi:transcriptional repressor NrdR|nr:transcriptional regulator NrdR [Nanoarchaeota archaeon]